MGGEDETSTVLLQVHVAHKWKCIFHRGPTVTILDLQHAGLAQHGTGWIVNPIQAKVKYKTQRPRVVEFATLTKIYKNDPMVLKFGRMV